MTEFNRDELENFLAAVRKYMGIRNINQKGLADMTNIGTSSMSRFLAMKTSDLNSQVIAKVIAKLEIPKSEYVDFVEEGYWNEFIRLVDFYKGLTDQNKEQAKGVGNVKAPVVPIVPAVSIVPEPESSRGTAQTQVTARVKIGGHVREIPFSAEGDYNARVNGLSYFQKKFIDDFLSLNGEGKDMVAKVGDDLVDYFKTKGMFS